MSVLPVRSIDATKKRRRGPLPLPAGELRVHGVSVRLNDAELARLDDQRSAPRMQRGEYLRAASLHQLPPSIPAMSRQAYGELGRVGGLLNQVARRLHESANGSEALSPSIHEISKVLTDLRLALIGAHSGLSEDAE